ncbi:MAG: ferric iron uptake transcriptional regulator [Sedimenticola sp.]
MTAISNKLKDVGLKVTHPRLTIIGILERRQGRHASAEDIYRQLLEEGEEIGIATIYRVLTQCEQAGLVKRLQFEGGRSVFELAEEDHHDHIVCIRCGYVEEFNDEMIEQRQQEIAARTGFTLEDHSMILYGLCAKCRKKA